MIPNNLALFVSLCPFLDTPFTTACKVITSSSKVFVKHLY